MYSCFFHQVRLLNACKIDPLCVDKRGTTLVHCAASTNQLSVIKWLVRKGKLPLTFLQWTDRNRVSPAIVAIVVRLFRHYYDENQIKHQATPTYILRLRRLKPGYLKLHVNNNYAL